MASNPKPRTAYNNPVFDLDTYQTAPDQREQAAGISIRDTASLDNDIAQLVYPNPESLFWRLKWQFWVLMFLVVAHICIIGYTDPIDSPQLVIQILVVSIQVAGIAVITMAFFIFTSQTIFIRFGRYDKYLKEFAFFYIVSLLQLILVGAVKAYFLLMFFKSTSYLAFEQSNIYFGLWVTQRMVLLAFWVMAAYSATQAFREEQYSPEYMLNSK